jgi:hypothetical protein
MINKPSNQYLGSIDLLPLAIEKDYRLVLQAQSSDSAVMQKTGPTETNLNSVRCMSTKNPTKRNER